MAEDALLRELLRIRATLIAAERAASGLIPSDTSDARHESAAESIRNFLHYHALRAHELRPLQRTLARMGLSSLGRSEAHVLATLDAVIRVLARLTGATPYLEPTAGAPTFESGRALLEARVLELLGPPPRGRDVRIMVTLSEADAGDPARVRALVETGMDVARINCAHDDADVWTALVRNVRAASEDTGRPCRIQMDLAGPKLRTGQVRSDIVLRAGDHLALIGDQRVGEPAHLGADGAVVMPFVSCSVPEVLKAVKTGEPVWFDDGKLGGRVSARLDGGVVVEITSAPIAGRALRAEKGINFPDTALELPALTASDRALLPFVARHADLVALSFVHSAADVSDLDGDLERLRSRCGVVLKIETKRGFNALPSIIVRGLAGRPIGVMVARGDLAVECGFQRLAEIQEEMLWLCEAAHLPVVWATQVLDRLARKGMPTRAEVTDAAMGERAECVMLNKGAHVLEAVRALDDILRRMAAHQYKKTPALRPLSLSRASSSAAIARGAIAADGRWP